MSSDPRLNLLLSRRSTPSRLLGAPGPSTHELESLVEAAACVPDHGRLRPWRLVLIRDNAGTKLGQALVDIRLARGELLADAVRDKDLHRFNRAPLVLVVISSVVRGHKIPEVEQLCSAAAVAQNLLLAAHALGYGAQWLTGWPAYDADVTRLLGLLENESILGFVHIGTAEGQAALVQRPNAAQLLQEWLPT